MTHSFYISFSNFTGYAGRKAMQTSKIACIGCITSLHRYYLCEKLKVMQWKASLSYFSYILHRLHSFLYNNKEYLELDLNILINSLIDNNYIELAKKLRKAMQYARFYYFTKKN